MMDWHVFLKPDEPGLLIEDAIEPKLHLSGAADEQWGHSDSLDPDNVGDIADEGAGHRG
jgi:hypothetical protein